MSAVKSAAVHLGGMRDGRKAIILISEGLRGIQRDATSMMTDLIRAANDNNTAIYAVDPRGLGQQRFPSLWEGVAADTGGDYFRSNDLDRAFNQVVVESSGYYLLGYSPTDRRLDGRFHKIKVRVKPSGLDVRARLGYWAPSVAEVERARVKAADAVLPPDVVRALSELPAATARRTVDFWVGTALDSGRPTVRLAWVPRARASAGAPRPAQVTAVATHGETRVFEGPVDAAGRIVCRAAGAAEGDVHRAGQRQRGDRPRCRGRLTCPTPPRRRSGLPRPRSSGPRTRASFAASIAVRTPCRFPAGNSCAPTVSSSGSRSRERRRPRRRCPRGSSASGARTLPSCPSRRAPSGDGPYELELPLSSVARGEFLIAISAGAGADSARAFVPIRVMR